MRRCTRCNKSVGLPTPVAWYSHPYFSRGWYKPPWAPSHFPQRRKSCLAGESNHSQSFSCHRQNVSSGNVNYGASWIIEGNSCGIPFWKSFVFGSGHLCLPPVFSSNVQFESSPWHPSPCVTLSSLSSQNSPQRFLKDSLKSIYLERK